MKFRVSRARIKLVGHGNVGEIARLFKRIRLCIFRMNSQLRV